MAQVRRSLLGGLAALLALTLAGSSTGDASASPVPAFGLGRAQDIASPVQPAERDADTTAIVPARPPAGGQPGTGTPRGDGQRQGSVVAVFQDPADPLIVISAATGYLTVRLRCGDLCPSIHLGDYVVAEGRRRSDAVFDAVEVWVVAP
ncbi:MAG: hypothetical protein IT306_31270 [Chloroflexi bacterium]|nr:hypothetical protein [Chloroflexota bacterium]